jgi:solute carrier family 6 (neurotransmitter transporter, taurine) member 6
VFSLIDYKSPTFNNGQYVYPTWASGIGWTIASLSLICIPLMAIIVLVRMPGDTFWEVKYTNCALGPIINSRVYILFQKFKNSIKSHIYECSICGSSDYCEHTPAEERLDDPFSMELTEKNKAKIVSSNNPNGLQKL